MKLKYHIKTYEVFLLQVDLKKTPINLALRSYRSIGRLIHMEVTFKLIILRAGLRNTITCYNICPGCNSGVILGQLGMAISKICSSIYHF